MFKRITYLLFLLAALPLAACDTELHQIEVCTYKVQLRYDYNEENTTRQNKIAYWVDHIDEYIFDDQGVLYHVRRVTENICTDNFTSEIDLPAGLYSVIVVGNRDDRSLVWDVSTGGVPVVGRTLRDDMRLSLEDADVFSDDTKGPCEELFHGYRSFSVAETGVSRVRVDVMNAHFQLRFRVRWRNTPTPNAGTYYATLDDISSEYDLMPEYIYPPGSFNIHRFSPTEDDEYPEDDNRVIHHIPYTGFQDHNPLNYSNTTYLNVDNEVWGLFVCYRIKTSTSPVLKLFYAASGTRAEDDPMVLPRQIDLQGYFRWYNYELDHELKQEYVLDILVDGDQIIINPLDYLTMIDWTDGGTLR